VTEQQFFVAAVPVFLAAFLGFALGLFTDWLKTRRENRKLSRERQEKELTQLNGAASAVVYNIEILLHIVMQQILPHREQSHAAAAALHAVENNATELRAFSKSMHSEFKYMMTRCPEPYFVELEFFKEIPFVLAKDPELLKRSGWMVSYTRTLKEILSERNKRIDMNVGTAMDLDFEALEEQIRIQAHIGDTEVINSLMLFEQFQAIRKKLEKIAEGYKNVFGAHLNIVLPEQQLDSTLRDLRRIAEAVVPEFPPPDPEG
jgi:hypothetical protein